MKAIWITWERQIRNVGMARELGMPLFELLLKGPRWNRYPVLAYRTIRLIRRENPEALFVQNPSIVLACLAVIIKRFSRINVIVDAHNSGLIPLEGRSRLLNWLARWIVTHSSLTIVTNSTLANLVTSWGGRPFVMPDPLPELDRGRPLAQVDDTPYVLTVCSWSRDEPYLEITAAAAEIGDIEFQITGNYRKILSRDVIQTLPKNVVLLGFISEEDYVAKLGGALAAIDLTTREDCLVCGAYEALALQVPMVIADSTVNREVFPRGFVYCRPFKTEIVTAVLDAIARRDELVVGLSSLSVEHSEATSRRGKQLMKRVTLLASEVSN